MWPQAEAEDAQARVQALEDRKRALRERVDSNFKKSQVRAEAGVAAKAKALEEESEKEAAAQHKAEVEQCNREKKARVAKEVEMAEARALGQEKAMVLKAAREKVDFNIKKTYARAEARVAAEAKALEEENEKVRVKARLTQPR